jgi:hypothetical protein
MQRAFRIGAFALATAACAIAFAAPLPARGRVLLDVAACPEVPEPAIRRIIGIEIGDLLLEAGAATPADADRLSVRCAGGEAAWLQARGAAGDPVDRTIRLTDFPGDAAPRALALAGIEMLAALSPAVRERLQTRQAAAPPASETAPAGGRIAVSASAVRRDFIGANGFGGWGGRVGVERPVGARWLASGDLELDGGGVTIALGDATAWLVSLGGFWGVNAIGAHVAGSLSLGARAGLARLDGMPAGGSGAVGASALRPWWGPAIAARGVLGRGALGAVLSLEAGFTARGAEALAGGATVLAVKGAWLTGGVGLRF